MFDESPESENKEESAKDGKDGGNVAGARRVGRGPCLLKKMVTKIATKNIQAHGWGSLPAKQNLVTENGQKNIQVPCLLPAPVLHLVDHLLQLL